MKLKRGLFTAIICTIAGASSAQNSVIQTHYSPDPTPMVYNGDDLPGFDFWAVQRWPP